MSAYRETMGQVLQRMYDNKQLQIQERELSDTELKRREEIAKELPDEEFKDRYGSRWKEVKLATATKQAKSESVEEENMEKMDEAAGFSAGMISKLKKSYSTLTKVDPTSPTAKKLFGVLDKMNKEQLIQIVKADINFLSLLAANRLIKDHNMKGAEINKLKKEEVDLDERARQLKDPKKEMMVSKGGDVKVIDKKDWPKYEKKGYVQAEENELDEGKMKDKLIKTSDLIQKMIKPGDPDRHDFAAARDHIEANNMKTLKQIVMKMDTEPKERVAVAMAKGLGKAEAEKILGVKLNMGEEVELDEKAKYDIYHKDFSSAMQHAYKAAKKMYGITVDPKEIDDKVATGPRKPSTGKTNTYRLKGDKGAIHVQVYNTGKKYELNMYKESHEMGTDEYRKYLEDLTPHSTESARSDAMRAMRRDKSMIRGKDSADVDDVATKDDRKAASKNILQQLKKTLDTKGKTDIEFLDKKKKKVPYDIAVKAVKKYMGFRSSTDKLKFQQALAKSYKSMLQAVKEDYVVPKTHSESILDRIDRKLKEKKNG